MTLSKRKSRKIIVNNEKYRWSPSQDSGYMILVVQNYSGQGKKLEVVISDDKNVIIENGTYTIECGSEGKLLITPNLVQKIINDALLLGWKPKDLGSPVELSLNDNILEIRRGL